MLWEQREGNNKPLIGSKFEERIDRERGIQRNFSEKIIVEFSL